MKKFICGLLVGLLLATCATVYADDIAKLIVNPNPFPILVNGTNQNIEAYNINGYTFLKLSQVGMATNSLVEFNTEKQQIEITTEFLKEEEPVVRESIATQEAGWVDPEKWVSLRELSEGKEWIISGNGFVYKDKSAQESGESLFNWKTEGQIFNGSVYLPHSFAEQY